VVAQDGHEVEPLKTLLGSVVSRGGVTEVVEAVGVDYGNALRRLDDLARTNLTKESRGW